MARNNGSASTNCNFSIDSETEKKLDKIIKITDPNKSAVMRRIIREHYDKLVAEGKIQ